MRGRKPDGDCCQTRSSGAGTAWHPTEESTTVNRLRTRCEAARNGGLCGSSIEMEEGVDRRPEAVGHVTDHPTPER
jgi:hypothetical protein